MSFPFQDLGCEFKPDYISPIAHLSLGSDGHIFGLDDSWNLIPFNAVWSKCWCTL